MCPLHTFMGIFRFCRVCWYSIPPSPAVFMVIFAICEKLLEETGFDLLVVVIVVVVATVISWFLFSLVDDLTSSLPWTNQPPRPLSHSFQPICFFSVTHSTDIHIYIYIVASVSITHILVLTPMFQFFFAVYLIEVGLELTTL